MTLFEYLAIAFGLLYSVAALRLLGGLAAATSAVARYWVHLSWVLLLLAGVVASFWTFWSLRDVAWTFPRFLLALTLPGLMYYCAAALVPEIPESVRSWREHFFAIHRRFFSGFGLWAVAAATGATVNLGMPLAHPARTVHITALVIGIIGATSRRHRVHAGIVVCMATLFLLWTVSAGVAPGWMAARQP